MSTLVTANHKQGIFMKTILSTIILFASVSCFAQQFKTLTFPVSIKGQAKTGTLTYETISHNKRGSIHYVEFNKPRIEVDGKKYVIGSDSDHSSILNEQICKRFYSLNKLGKFVGYYDTNYQEPGIFTKALLQPSNEPVPRISGVAYYIDLLCCNTIY